MKKIIIAIAILSIAAVGLCAPITKMMQMVVAAKSGGAEPTTKCVGQQSVCSGQSAPGSTDSVDYTYNNAVSNCYCWQATEAGTVKAVHAYFKEHTIDGTDGVDWQMYVGVWWDGDDTLGSIDLATSSAITSTTNAWVRQAVSDVSFTTGDMVCFGMSLQNTSATTGKIRGAYSDVGDNDYNRSGFLQDPFTDSTSSGLGTEAFILEYQTP